MRWKNDERFQDALDSVLAEEGGRANDPNDRGGLTMAGITQETYDRYRTRKNLPPRPVDESTHDERVEAYYEDYWVRGQCRAFPAPFDYLFFDTIVQHGRAVRLMQEAMGVKADGMIGPITRGAVTNHPQGLAYACRALLRRRLRYYAQLASDEGRNDPEKVFLPGWVFRLSRLWDHVELHFSKEE